MMYSTILKLTIHNEYDEDSEAYRNIFKIYEKGLTK
ncbi:hypothetical protein J2X97_000683 [Epilithonimonas hungarica]|nr:hypothetical protein [Epilithonimonas hungarica]